jgi:hypothetical protein
LAVFIVENYRYGALVRTWRAEVLAYRLVDPFNLLLEKIDIIGGAFRRLELARQLIQYIFVGILSFPSAQVEADCTKLKNLPGMTCRQPVISP